MSIRLQTSSLAYTTLLKEFKKALGTALKLTRDELAYMVPALRTNDELVSAMEPEVKEAKDVLKATDGNMVKVGVVVEFLDKNNKYHPMEVVRISKNIELGIHQIEARPIDTEGQAAVFYGDQHDNGNVTYSKTNLDTSLRLPKGVRMRILPDGNPGAGVCLPFGLCVKQMLHAGFLEMTASGTIHIRLGKINEKCCAVVVVVVVVRM